MIAAFGDSGFKFMTLRKVLGTNGQIFLAFINQVMNMLPLGRRFCFLCDNLNSHLIPAVFNAIIQRGHMVVPRPAYYPVDGPSEYFFNQIEQKLSQIYIILRRNENDLIAAITTIFTNLQNLNRTFRHFGYPLGFNDPIRSL